jgi:ubiquinone/menaquinone biosynthesis C-methylase UbiE
MYDYQKSFVANVARVIDRSYSMRKPRIDILDMGCDITGQQTGQISALTSGTVVGINIPTNFPSIESQQAAGSKAKLIRMDATQLDFPDESFDVVISANVIEHVNNLQRFIQEAARVLKKGGVCYMETATIWTSGRGHHVMESMIKEHCPNETNYRDDGSVIPDWSHLYLTRQQMGQLLGRSLLPETCEYILHYLYDSNDLSKVGWRDIKHFFEDAFPFVKLSPFELPSIDLSKKPMDNNDDYAVYGFSVCGRKRPETWAQRHLFWRLRKAGLKCNEN